MKLEAAKNNPLMKKEKVYKYDIYGRNIIRFLKSRLFAILISFSLILLQAIHPAKVMMQFGVFEGIWNTIYSYTFSLLIEFFVIYYVVKDVHVENKLNMSAYFAIFSIIINAYFYTSQLCVENNQFVFNYAIIPALCFALVIPLSIYKVSEKINSIA